MATDRSRLEAANARYEEWSAQTASTRETAGKDKAELQRRGHVPSRAETPDSHSTLEWWRESQAHGEVADQALARLQPEIAEPEPDRHDERAARLDALQARANDAAARIEAQQAQQNASNQYTARMGREAQAEPEVSWQAEALDEIEMELQ